MLALGQFAFGLSTLAYNDFQRQTIWRHPSNSRVGTMPARQFVGQGEDTITLCGVLMPELLGSPTSLSELREMAKSGKAWPLVDGAGNVFGSYVIESQHETGTLHIAEGLPRRVEFQLCLTCVDDRDFVDAIGRKKASQGGTQNASTGIEIDPVLNWNDL